MRPGPIPPSVAVWRSVRQGGDTKTAKSRRTFALPETAIQALREHRKRQAEDRLAAGPLWQDHGLVFASAIGTPLDAANVRREFRKITEAAGLGTGWAPRDLRHTFVSLMSADGVPIEEIARLAGHNRTATTELVYRHELRPVITTGAEVMDRILSREASARLAPPSLAHAPDAGLALREPVAGRAWECMLLDLLRSGGLDHGRLRRRVARPPSRRLAPSHAQQGQRNGRSGDLYRGDCRLAVGQVSTCRADAHLSARAAALARRLVDIRQADRCLSLQFAASFAMQRHQVVCGLASAPAIPWEAL